MNIYKKQVLFALLILSVGLFTGNAIAMDFDNNFVTDDRMVDEYNGEQNNYYENLRQQMKSIENERLQVCYVSRCLEKEIDSMDVTLKSRYISSIIDDSEKYDKKKRELNCAILERNNNVDRLNNLIDQEAALKDLQRQLLIEHKEPFVYGTWQLHPDKGWVRQ